MQCRCLVFTRVGHWFGPERLKTGRCSARVCLWGRTAQAWDRSSGISRTQRWCGQPWGGTGTCGHGTPFPAQPAAGWARALPCNTQRPSLLACTCYVYFYAYLLCTVKITRKPLGEKSRSSPLCRWMSSESGVPDSPPPAHHQAADGGSLGGVEVEQGLSGRGCPGSPVGLALHPGNLAAPFCWGCQLLAWYFPGLLVALLTLLPRILVYFLAQIVKDFNFSYKVS